MEDPVSVRIANFYRPPAHGQSPHDCVGCLHDPLS